MRSWRDVCLPRTQFPWDSDKRRKRWPSSSWYVVGMRSQTAAGVRTHSHTASSNAWLRPKVRKPCICSRCQAHIRSFQADFRPTKWQRHQAAEERPFHWRVGPQGLSPVLVREVWIPQQDLQLSLHEVVVIPLSYVQFLSPAEWRNVLNKYNIRCISLKSQYHFIELVSVTNILANKSAYSEISRNFSRKYTHASWKVKPTCVRHLLLHNKLSPNIVN